MSGLTAAQAEEGATQAGADRRAWVRYPCSLEASCHSIASVADVLWSAKIRDISAGGLRLLVSRRFETGTVLQVEVRTGIEATPTTFLARVMNAAPEPGGDWALGCAFARELDDEDLRAFSAQKAKPVRPDCRAWIRFSCEADTVLSSTTSGEPERWPATVLNISPSGIGFRVSRDFPVSALLSLELPGLRSEPEQPVLARVVHATPQDDGEWVIGCAFNDALTDKELQNLL